MLVCVSVLRRFLRDRLTQRRRSVAARAGRPPPAAASTASRRRRRHAAVAVRRGAPRGGRRTTGSPPSGPGGAPHVGRSTACGWTARCASAVRRRRRWVRNLQPNALISVHLPHDDEVVILEGTAELVTDAAPSTRRRHRHGRPAPSTRSTTATSRQTRRSGRSGCCGRTAVYAWTLSGFPGNVTRWQFD